MTTTGLTFDTDPAPAAPVHPAQEPQRIAPDTYLILDLAPGPPPRGTYVFVNSLVILAAKPIVVDTGAPYTVSERGFLESDRAMPLDRPRVPRDAPARANHVPLAGRGVPGA
jgi:hypothetical protein